MLADQRGATMIFVGVAAFMLVICVAAAIDMGRVQLVRNKVSSALDAAALSAGAFATSADPQQAAQRYFDANYPPGYMGATLQPIEVEDPNGDKSVLRFSITGNVPTMLIGHLSHDAGLLRMNTSASAEITRTADRQMVELALVLDTTGSMRDRNKLEQLKSSVQTMMDLLFESEPENLFISVVPFNTMVNIRPHNTDWARNLTRAGTWEGCVLERNGVDIETPPGASFSTKFRKYYRVDEVPGEEPEGGIPNYEECPPSASAVRANLDNEAAVMSIVNAMEAQGSTRVNVGMAWGWRTLSPSWKGVFNLAGESPDHPMPYGTPNLSKVVILMTDGSNSKTIGDGESTVHENNLALANICAQMKQNPRNIVIYTIAFDITDAEDEATIRNLLQNQCATQPDYYFEAANGNALVNAFRTIADSINNLRLSR